jgi:hypothetical protein
MQLRTKVPDYFVGGGLKIKGPPENTGGHKAKLVQGIVIGLK